MFRSRWIDVLFLAVLMIFVLIGTPLATFHGDESMQVYMSRDYWVAFVYRVPDELKTSPPYPADTDHQLRILNGTLNRHLIGLFWQIAGYNDADLPPRPGWDWGLSYADNFNTGHRPSDAQMLAARLPSAILLALSVPLMYALGHALGGRRMAWIAAALFALHPVLLLQGRRATQEGAMLFFGLLTIWIAVKLTSPPRPTSQRQQGIGRVFPPLHLERGLGREVALWLALAGAGALAIASKHSAIVFVVSAWAWIAVANLIPMFSPDANRVDILKREIGIGAALIVVAALTLGLFVALSPALWNDPVARLGDLLAVRAELLSVQVAVTNKPPMSLLERIAFIVREPFIAPPTHFEVTWWSEVTPIRLEIERYMASPLSGLQTHNLIGVVLTICAGIGVIGSLRAFRRAAHIGLLAWAGITAVSLLANPLNWQRYALPFIPVAILLVALGLNQVISTLQARLNRRSSPTT